MNQKIEYTCNECKKTHIVTVRQECYYDNMFKEGNEAIYKPHTNKECKACGCLGGYVIKDKWYCAACYEENNID